MSYKYHEPLEAVIVESSTPIIQATINFTKMKKFWAKLFGLKLVQLYNHTIKVTIEKARKGRGYLSFVGKGGVLRDLDGNYWLITSSETPPEAKEMEELELKSSQPIPKISELSGKLYVAQRGSYGKE